MFQVSSECDLVDSVWNWFTCAQHLHMAEVLLLSLEMSLSVCAINIVRSLAQTGLVFGGVVLAL